MIKSGIIICLFVIGSALAEGFTSKIVNGTDAESYEFPFMVNLRRNKENYCGGTILNDLWVMTAGHCLKLKAENYSVQYASLFVSPDGPNVVAVAEIILHEEYLPANLETMTSETNDIGLVRLVEPMRIDLNDYRVKLPIAGSNFYTGTPAVLAGWGLNATGGVKLTNLQRVDVMIFSSFDCARLHRSPVHYTNICGGITGGGKGHCNGDSGGPLLVDGVQVGITSWSEKPCTIAPYPGVYTAVAHYIDWIEKKTGINFTKRVFLRSPAA